MLELILHLLGDYVLQSDWMAQNKVKRFVPAFVHAVVYSLPFLFLTRSLFALFVICSTHFLIDRYRLAKYVVYAKNFLAPPSATFCLSPNDPDLRHGDYFGDVKEKFRWANCESTGYPSETPAWLAVWLLIIADNTLHLLINHLALKFL